MTQPETGVKIFVGRVPGATMLIVEQASPALWMVAEGRTTLP
jgi:hypothetical protein